jgi:Carboxypeptidase regulatory-like domain/Viral BACON domain
MLNRLIRNFVIIIISIFLYSCPPAPELPGVIKGLVTDAKTSEPVYKAKVRLNTPDDTTSTGIDGSYLLKNINPDNYVIQASKFGYKTETENVTVKSALTKEINFSLTKISTITVSSTLLDFGIDSTTLKFKLSKTGTGILTYNISTSQSWLTTSSPAGFITEETDTVIVTVNINRTDLVKRKYKETIIVSDIGETQEVK